MQVRRLGVVRGPAQDETAAGLGAVDDRTPLRPAGGEGHGLFALHANLLRAVLDFLPTFGGLIKTVGGDLRREGDDIRRVHIGVGEPPGDAAIAADHHERHARQRDPHHPVRPGFIGPLQQGAIPDVRHVEVEVHVVREHRGACGGVRPAEREGIRTHNAFAGGLDGGEAGGGRFGFAETQRRQRSGREGAAIERGVPGIAAGREKIEARLAQGRAQRVPVQVEGALVILQVEPHGVDAQQRVLLAPRLRRGADHEVFPRDFPQRSEAGVDAGGVGREDGPLGGLSLREHLCRQPAEAVQAGALVQVDRGRAEQFRQFARATTAQQVHLEKTVLRVEETRGAGHIGAGRTDYGGHTKGIALDLDRGGQAGDGALAVEQGQATAHLPPTPDDGGDDDQQEPAEHGENPTQSCAPGRHVIAPRPGCRPDRGPHRNRGSRTWS